MRKIPVLQITFLVFSAVFVLSYSAFAFADYATNATAVNSSNSTTSVQTSYNVSANSTYPATCPIPPIPQCPAGSVLSPKVENGCVVGYGCQTVAIPNVTVNPAPQLPPNCRQVTDPTTGLVSIVCSQPNQAVPQPACPSEQYLESQENTCEQHGGTPSEIETPANCTVVTCSFNNFTAPTFARATCLSGDEINSEVQKCAQTGFTPKADFENGCTVIKCTQQRLTVENAIENESFSIQNEQSGACMTTIPDQAATSCQDQGGAIVVQRDSNGCITFGQCVSRGDASQSLASPSQSVPSTTDLLSITVSLEQLKVELSQAKSQVQSIANYYSTSSPQDAQRFQRVVGILDTAIQKTSDIETKIKSNIGNLTTDDMTQVKHDVLYIRDVMLKDAVYLMLGSNADATISTNQDCGSDSSCFNEAFRICEPSTFTPSAGQPFKVTVLGLQGTSCQMRVELTSGPNTGSMVCTFDNYALGFTSNPQSFLSHCQGSLVSYMQQYISHYTGG